MNNMRGNNIALARDGLVKATYCLSVKKDVILERLPNMKIVKAEIGDADIIGQIHSRAWKQAYADMFPEEYLCTDTQGKRTQEFLESCNNKDIHYFLLYSDETAIGIVKVVKYQVFTYLMKFKCGG